MKSTLTKLFQPFHVSTGGNKEWRVVCHGYYLDVYVVDVLTLEVSMLSQC